jgi:hypothetical protein
VESGISGLAPPREWDASAIADLPGLLDPSLTELDFVVLPEGVVVGDIPRPVARRLVRDLGLEPPYRALAVRRAGDNWAVGAVAIEVAELPADIEGEELTLTVNELGERELIVDERPSVAEIETLVGLARGRHDTFVLRAQRLQDRLWEVRIDPL